VELCRIAAPTGKEERRAGSLAGRLKAEGLAVARDGAGNVLAEVPGEPDLPRVALVAHLDTVFPDEGTVEVSRDGDWLAAPGIGDNSAGLAALLAVARRLPRSGLGPILLVGTVGEEGNGDLRGARHLVESRGAELDLFLAVEGAMRDRVVRAAIGIERLRLTVRGPGGHSWGDAGTPGAIEAAAEAVRRLYDLELPSEPRTTLGVGTIRGGQSINSIPAETVLEVDLRSLDPEVVADLRSRAVSAARSCVPEGGPLELTVEPIGSRPAGALPADHPLLRHVREARREAGLAPAEEIASSTDANIPLAAGIPACAVGVGRGENVHRRSERLDVPSLRDGFRALLGLVRRVAGDPALRRPQG
jgi:acetylornithine deacetylase/succinyl-diaminopimelate desuccinylase-like protein